MIFKVLVCWWAVYAFLKIVSPPAYHQPMTGANYLRRQTEAGQAWK